jgi:4-hydroxybenzoate polyprenyltransferase
MTIAAVGTPSLLTLLKLGRASNLPTVWTNVLAGTLLSGGAWHGWRTAVVLAAMTLFYVGGMYLNDYFDRAIDTRERPERPIPAQEISPFTVAAIGAGLLGGASC